MSELTNEELMEMRRRCERATPGPWTSVVEGRDQTAGDSFIMVGDAENRRDDMYLTGGSPADLDFIAHARQDVPRLLEEIARLRKLVSGS